MSTEMVNVDPEKYCSVVGIKFPSHVGPQKVVIINMRLVSSNVTGEVVLDPSAQNIVEEIYKKHRLVPDTVIVIQDDRVVKVFKLNIDYHP